MGSASSINVLENLVELALYIKECYNLQFIHFYETQNIIPMLIITIVERKDNRKEKQKRDGHIWAAKRFPIHRPPLSDGTWIGRRHESIKILLYYLEV